MRMNSCKGSTCITQVTLPQTAHDRHTTTPTPGLTNLYFEPRRHGAGDEFALHVREHPFPRLSTPKYPLNPHRPGPLFQCLGSSGSTTAHVAVSCSMAGMQVCGANVPLAFLFLPFPPVFGFLLFVCCEAAA